MEAEKILFRNFKSLSDSFSDIRVVVEGKTYSCHKIILSSASEFFKRLLVTDCKETSSGVINLEDVQTSTFDIIYDFIYSAGDKAVLKHAPIPVLLELLICADKWFMPCLTAACIYVIVDCEPWTMDELITGLDTALTLNNLQLKKIVEDILCHRRKEMVCPAVVKMNSTNLKEYLKFCRPLVSEKDRFEMIEMWIKNQTFYSPGMEYSSSDTANSDVAELLSIIDYENMGYEDFLFGPGDSDLLSYQEKYTKLCVIYNSNSE